jgi:uncharacterized protein (TIGR00369 family)
VFEVSDVRSPSVPPYYFQVGFLIHDQADGTTTTSARPGPWLEELSAMGSPAAAAGYADIAFGSSVSTLDLGKMPVSTSLHLDFLAPVPTGPMTCTSAVSDLQDGVALTTGRIEAGGRPLADATMRSMLIAPRPPSGAAEAPAPAPAPTEGDDQGVALPPDTEGLLELQLAEACRTRVVSADERSLELSMVPAPELYRSHGAVHGGGVAALGCLAIAVVRAHALGGVAGWRHLDARVDFLRQLPADREIRLLATARHVGGRLALFDVEVAAPDRRLSAYVRETVLVRR